MAKIVIIGGGASGIIAALTACNNSNDVTIIEHNNVLAKKILVTGNGHCNYWHNDVDIDKYNSCNRELIPNILNEKNKEKALDILDKIGIIPKIKNGYYYPFSNQAVSVQNALINAVKRNKIKIITDCEVIDVYKTSNFTIKTSLDGIKADKVIIATGGLAASKTGSTGKGYEIASKFGHKIIKPLPALVQLKTDFKYIKELSGIRSDVTLTLVEDDDLIMKENGELQHTDYGISGICAMQLSSKIARGLNEGKKEEVLINYIPLIAQDSLSFNKWFNNHKKKISNITIGEFLDQLLNYKLANLILKINSLAKEKTINDLDEDEINKLGETLTKFNLNIIGTNSFDNAQTTSGGISLKEINTKTLESQIVNNLYFCGEIIDIDGKCGGYNLALAWITGYIAGTSASRGDNNDNN